MSSKIQPASDSMSVVDDVDSTKLPIKPIPGSYGIPFISPIKDRLDFYYFQGREKFFQSRIQDYNSTVFSVNMPPGPFMASDPRVICVLDAKSFPVLFDVSKVEKKNLFTGTYMPSTKLTGGYRVCSYLDPSEPKHAQVKQLLFDLLASRKSHVIPTFRSNYSSLFDAMEKELSGGKPSADFTKLNDGYAFEFIGSAYFGTPPSNSPDLGDSGPSKATKWLFLQLCPILTLGLPKILEEIFLHTFPLPPCIVKSDYKALYSYFSSAAENNVLSDPSMLHGLSKSEACHNLLFAATFNSYGGIKVLFPSILRWLAQAGPTLHAQLAKEIRAVVKADGGEVTLSGLEKMELTKSVLYEVFRIEPPVPFQYAKANKDFILESHDAAYHVKKGEMLFGYQPIATKDGKVFHDPNKFVPDRFLGEKGKALIKYVWWSNGPETESPTLANKQCAGKNFVVLIGRLLLVELFIRYDTFTADISQTVLGAQILVNSVTKATTTVQSSLAANY